MDRSKKKTTPSDFEEVLKEEIITIGQASALTCELLETSESYFKRFVRPKLNPRPLFSSGDGSGKKLAALKLYKYELLTVIYEIKKGFKLS